ncbi:MAG: hypothetical protein IPP06_18780 [Saprospiraceae bacterium]|nr:hypothetical protein [Candidatus Vicinibacter affinis]
MIGTAAPRVTIALALCAAAALVARGDEPPPAVAPTVAPTVDAAAGARAFATVARVLQSPRCQNCHPAGDRPLQGDRGRPHRMNVSRRSVAAGLTCGACHQPTNADRLGVVGGPPGAPHWGLPPAATPMIFQGRTPAALCAQLKDPAQTGGRDLPALLHHVASDPLVLWAWSPGGRRTPPPVPHAAFVEAFTTWVASGGACP